MDIVENSLSKIDNSIAFINKENSIIENYEKSTVSKSFENIYLKK